MGLKRNLGRIAFLTFIFLSLVSLFADMTYEGARSTLGPYLEALEASAIIAGVVSVGELVSYASRGLGGYIAGISRSSKVYWALVFVGYGINIFAIPLLAIVGNWELAFLLILIERLGKGLRAPARDVILSEVTKNIGRGKAFGFHELMDQLGAFTGPLIVSFAIYKSGYPAAFAILAIPAVLSVTMLMIAHRLYPTVKSIEIKPKKKEPFPKPFMWFMASMVFMSLGFASWFLLSYYYKAEGLFSPYFIPLLYSLAMVVDAIIALPVGILYDKIGIKSLLITPFLISFIIPLTLTKEFGSIVIAIILWGLVMGIYETNMRATIADMTSPEQRSFAYGAYGVAFGFSWTIGNVTIASLYQAGLWRIMVIYPILMEIIALILLIITIRSFTHR